MKPNKFSKLAQKSLTLTAQIVLIVIAVAFLSLISFNAFSANDRIALIIGNSKYQNLGTLNNTINDAKAIEKSLKEIGYKTKIVFDVNENQIRKEIKSFALESERASLALLFYAGHGAQVFGENYILPTDLEIPQRESDIQLSGVKVDDIINSIRSKTKVIFLDACRDNPALIKSLSKGRGSYQGGLAPTKNSSMSESNSSIFIAYSTDSGNVALDGNGALNSPFTSSLIKFIREPISIDDMFSKVTRDVKEKTNNSQKPYKYASLDGIVCLTSNCNGVSISKNSSMLIPKESSGQFFSNENSEIQRLAAVANFYSTNKDTKNKKDGLSSDRLPNEWTIFNFDTNDYVWSINPSTVKRIKNLVTGDVRMTPLKDDKITATYSYVINCETFKAGVYALKESNSSGKVNKDIKYGEPEFSELPYDFSDKNTLGYAGAMLACNPEFMVPLTPANTDLNSEEWHRSYTGEDEKTQNYYLPSSLNINGNMIYVLVKEKWKKAQSLSDNASFALLKGKDSNFIKWEQRVNLAVTECNSDKYQYLAENLYDTNGRLIANIGYLEKTRQLSVLNVMKGTTMDFIRKEYCK